MILLVWNPSAKRNTREDDVMALPNQSLAIEEEFFASHISEWSERDDYEGRWALVKGRKLVGVFEEYAEAVQLGFEKFELEPFLISQILRDPPPVTTTAIILDSMFRSYGDADSA